jgi:enoyl-CoA hydratase/carnithine racemase
MDSLLLFFKSSYPGWSLMKLIPPKKVRIFSYNTFTSALLLETKGLEILFHDDFISSEMLFELESIMAWCTSHTEVKSVLFHCKDNKFLQGFNFSDFKNFDAEKIVKMYSKLRVINQALLCLPQTIIVDLKDGAKNEGLSIAMAADIRVSNTEAVFQFNHGENGLLDASGTFSFIKASLNQSFLRSLTLSGMEFSITELNQLGVHTFANKTAQEILVQINLQSSVARAQMKCAMLGLDEINHNENQFVEKLLNSLLLTNDYKKESDFINLRELKEKLSEASLN